MFVKSLVMSDHFACFCMILSETIATHIYALFGFEFCIGVVGAEATLNRLQVTWARHLLGFPNLRVGPWSILIAECGWPMRLGTKMFERAILLKARIQLLPPSHHAHSLLRAATCESVDSWCS